MRQVFTVTLQATFDVPDGQGPVTEPALKDALALKFSGQTDMGLQVVSVTESLPTSAVPEEELQPA